MKSNHYDTISNDSDVTSVQSESSLSSTSSDEKSLSFPWSREAERDQPFPRSTVTALSISLDWDSDAPDPPRKLRGTLAPSWCRTSPSGRSNQIRYSARKVGVASPTSSTSPRRDESAEDEPSSLAPDPLNGEFPAVQFAADSDIESKRTKKRRICKLGETPTDEAPAASSLEKCTRATSSEDLYIIDVSEEDEEVNKPIEEEETSKPVEEGSGVRPEEPTESLLTDQFFRNFVDLLTTAKETEDLNVSSPSPSQALISGGARDDNLETQKRKNNALVLSPNTLLSDSLREPEPAKAPDPNYFPQSFVNNPEEKKIVGSIARGRPRGRPGRSVGGLSTSNSRPRGGSAKRVSRLSLTLRRCQGSKIDIVNNATVTSTLAAPAPIPPITVDVSDQEDDSRPPLESPPSEDSAFQLCRQEMARAIEAATASLGPPAATPAPLETAVMSSEPCAPVPTSHLNPSQADLTAGAAASVPPPPPGANLAFIVDRETNQISSCYIMAAPTQAQRSCGYCCCCCCGGGGSGLIAAGSHAASLYGNLFPVLGQGASFLRKPPMVLTGAPSSYNALPQSTSRNPSSRMIPWTTTATQPGSRQPRFFASRPFGSLETPPQGRVRPGGSSFTF